jgi:hypothetical protein
MTNGGLRLPTSRMAQPIGSGIKEPTPVTSPSEEGALSTRRATRRAARPDARARAANREGDVQEGEHREELGGLEAGA